MSSVGGANSNVVNIHDIAMRAKEGPAAQGKLSQSQNEAKITPVPTTQLKQPLDAATNKNAAESVDAKPNNDQSASNVAGAVIQPDETTSAKQSVDVDKKILDDAKPNFGTHKGAKNVDGLIKGLAQAIGGSSDNANALKEGTKGTYTLTPGELAAFGVNATDVTEFELELTISIDGNGKLTFSYSGIMSAENGPMFKMLTALKEMLDANNIPNAIKPELAVIENYPHDTIENIKAGSSAYNIPGTPLVVTHNNKNKEFNLCNTNCKVEQSIKQDTLKNYGLTDEDIKTLNENPRNANSQNIISAFRNLLEAAQNPSPNLKLKQDVEVVDSIGSEHNTKDKQQDAEANSAGLAKLAGQVVVNVPSTQEGEEVEDDNASRYNAHHGGPQNQKDTGVNLSISAHVTSFACKPKVATETVINAKKSHTKNSKKSANDINTKLETIKDISSYKSDKSSDTPIDALKAVGVFIDDTQNSAIKNVKFDPGVDVFGTADDKKTTIQEIANSANRPIVFFKAKHDDYPDRTHVFNPNEKGPEEVDSEYPIPDDAIVIKKENDKYTACNKNGVDINVSKDVVSANEVLDSLGFGSVVEFKEDPSEALSKFGVKINEKANKAIKTVKFDPRFSVSGPENEINEIKEIAKIENKTIVFFKTSPERVHIFRPYQNNETSNVYFGELEKEDYGTISEAAICIVKIKDKYAALTKEKTEGFVEESVNYVHTEEPKNEKNVLFGDDNFTDDDPFQHDFNSEDDSEDDSEDGHAENMRKL